MISQFTEPFLVTYQLPPHNEIFIEILLLSFIMSTTNQTIKEESINNEQGLAFCDEMRLELVLGKESLPQEWK